MFELSRSTVDFVKQCAMTSVDGFDAPVEQIETRVIEMLTQPTDIEYNETLLRLDKDAQNKRIHNERRQLAKIAISYAPAMYPSSLVRTTASLAYSLAQALKEDDYTAVYPLNHVRIDTHNAMSGFVYDETLASILPGEKASAQAKRSYMYLSELFMRAGPSALKNLSDSYRILRPTMYPIGMLVDQLERMGNPNGKPEALIIASRDDENGALHNDPVYESIAKACAKPKSPVLPTIVEFGSEYAEELILALIEPRNLVLGFINSHGNWDNIDGMQKDQLYEIITPKERQVIQQNWRRSAGIGLLSCYAGAQCAEDGEDGADVTLAKIIRKPVVASDSLTDIVSVTRRSGLNDRWTVNFHMPKGSGKVATLHTPPGAYCSPNLAVLDRRTVFYDSVAA